MRNINILRILNLCLLLLACSVSNATSLYNKSTYESIVSDHVATNVGDSITVLIYEEASAGADAQLDAHKATDLSVGVTDTTAPERRGISIGSGYDGGAGVSRAGNLLASITARVIAIDSNGELKIQGNQKIELNEDVQTISLEGYVRREDIAADNTIASTRLSNANISYLAEGTLADRQKPGWLTQIFHWIF